MNQVHGNDRPGIPPGRGIWRVSLTLTAILLFGAILRGLYLREIVHHPDFYFPPLDAAYHDYWARAIATGDWSLPRQVNIDNFSDPDIQTSPYFRPPGYPYFLAMIYRLTGGNMMAALAVQMLLGLFNCVLAYLLGRRLFGRGAGLITAACMSGYWAFIYFEGELLAPVLTITLALALALFIFRWYELRTFRRAFLAGATLGALALVRPNLLLLGPAFMGWSVWVCRRGRHARFPWMTWLGFLAASCLMIAPVTARNYLVSHEFVPITSNLGINLYIANNEEADGYTPSAHDLQRYTGLGGWRSSDYPRIVRGVEAQFGRKMSHSEVSSYFTGLAIEYVRSHPSDALALLGKKAALFWGPAEVSNNKEIYFEKQNSPVLRHIPGFAMVLSLAIIGLIRLILDRPLPGSREGAPGVDRGTLELSVMIILLILSYFLSYLPFFAASRFRVPVIPFLFLIGAYGLYGTGRSLVHRRWSGVLPWIPAYAIAYLAAAVPIVPYHPDAARWHFSRGVAYELGGEADPAAHEYRVALDLDPDLEMGHRNLADLLVRRGDYQGAARHYREALRLNPDQVNVHNNLGNVYQILGNFEEAVRQYDRVLQLDPDNAAAYVNLGISSQSQGRLDEAVSYYRQAVRLDPADVNSRFNMANILRSQGKLDEAIDQYRQVIQVSPGLVEARAGLARALASLARYDQAIEQYREVLEQKPDYLPALNALAWILATRPDTGSRRPDRAIALAERACRLTGYRNPTLLNTLAAAYASAGRFDRAADTAESALERASAGENRDLEEDIRKRLERYRGGEL